MILGRLPSLMTALLCLCFSLLATMSGNPSWRHVQWPHVFVCRHRQIGRRRNVIIITELWWLEGRAAER